MNKNKIQSIPVTCLLLLTFLLSTVSCKGCTLKDENTSLSQEESILTPAYSADEIILERTGYVASYDVEHRIPKWVAWTITSEKLQGDFRRPGNAFHEDTDVPRPRACNADYKDSGWSKGHMCPAGDSKWSREAMYDTFLYTNICPQDRNLNSGTWNQIEISCRRWAEKYGQVYVVCGPILYRQEHEVIGSNKVTVPEAFFKVVLRLGDNPKAIAFVCKNNDGNGKKDKYVNSLSQVERITGLVFFPNMDANLKGLITDDADINDW